VHPAHNDWSGSGSADSRSLDPQRRPGRSEIHRLADVALLFASLTGPTRMVTGWLLGYDTFNIRLLDGKEQLRSFVKSDLRSHGFIESPMPSYKSTLSAQELADVVSYLSSLRTTPATPAGPGR